MAEHKDLIEQVKAEAEENDNFEREKIYGKKILQRVAISLGKSERTIYQAVEFAQKYPDIQKLPEGKNISWHKICNNLLPEVRQPVIY
ncbi:MAG: hypothetical protein A2626_02820 [Candidatus Nealsonbacteria bacterium RIFCSPHIGHO2_01_FULL_38_55]|uniref:Uncharacterized protein n=1 Tax=Candidatus Nealsonbacteria bacterium RIFCSPHIGHO2_01_FULL_38_55 TaxID=1801664 RepID=A0A1G2E1S7_9BACT|nr:MAG: hypothetical protein US88_C0002G0036 [Parcubacteria group bacterium GW2011_GWA2_38_27]OGZ19642.1 MAG: hypothetical protein A2626_02820 [Candidatus Nealsonbacteria bacterium RIFCSPHIGHO2_01_FULL_38_55]OGZ21912.1 MAG: hypothetical protein A3C48_00120 [Candidatus Nealsonbacteria bacterium RIFCSPHIGHO2_02_FULL_38_75]OGZ22728.1 MAG: hypothetical protein A2981_01465 [Candidatus Nealsonbacteria bacterium RIFCSPLOWO2_01_FULL_38_120]OGZ26281.1 MAG: hypothetical protein A3I85_01305 [Candidatus Ne